MEIPTPLSLSLWWGLGFCLMVFNLLQMVSGVILTTHLEIFGEVLFNKMTLFKESLFKGVLMNTHTTLPNLIFVITYLHTLKNLMNPMQLVWPLWLNGMVLYISLIFICFTGYSFIGSETSYSALIVVKQLIKEILGGFMADTVFKVFLNENVSLLSQKIFMYHYSMSILLLGVMITHLNILHNKGSSQMCLSWVNNSSMSMTLLMKDLFLMILLSLIIAKVMFFKFMILKGGGLNPDFNKHVDVEVEWYLSVYFILLKMLNSKFQGVLIIMMFLLFKLFKINSSDCYGVVNHQLTCLLIMIILGVFNIKSSMDLFFYYSKIVEVGLVLLYLMFFGVGFNMNIYKIMDKVKTMNFK